MDFQGKNIVYIGGFGGIGAKCVEKFLQKNVANLFILDLNSNKEYLGTLQMAYPSANIAYIAMDMSKFETIENSFRAIMQKVDRIDVLINGSGILNEEQIALAVAVNLVASRDLHFSTFCN